MTSPRVLLACLLLALFAASCGDDASQESAAAPEPTAGRRPSRAAGESTLGDDQRGPVREARGRQAQRATPPAELVTEDVVEGKGPAAKAGDTVRCSTWATSWSTGEQFDASWDSGQPFTFQLGAGRVIPGWDQGIAGMKEGGRRLLIIPPDLAYGAQGAGAGDRPNETLVFVVDLEKIQG